MQKVWIDYSTFFFFYDHKLKTAYKVLPFSGVFLQEKLISPFFWRHQRWQLHANMSIGHKKLQENVQSQFKYLSNECKKFGLIIRHTFFSMIMNSKLVTKFCPFQAYSSLKGPFCPNLAYFRRHPRSQLHKNMPIRHKKLQENVQSQFKHLSNECKTFGLIIRHTFFSVIMNSKVGTKKNFSLHRTVTICCCIWLSLLLKTFLYQN